VHRLVRGVGHMIALVVALWFCVVVLVVTVSAFTGLLS
jgi:hypothetical protein